MYFGLEWIKNLFVFFLYVEVELKKIVVLEGGGGGLVLIVYKYIRLRNEIFFCVLFYLLKFLLKIFFGSVIIR